MGADVFLQFNQSLEDLIIALECCIDTNDRMTLEMIDNRGMIVWPQKRPGIFLSDSFRARFRIPTTTVQKVTHHQVINLLERLSSQGLEFLNVELLYNFDGKPGFTQGQGA